MLKNNKLEKHYFATVCLKSLKNSKNTHTHTHTHTDTPVNEYESDGPGDSPMPGTGGRTPHRTTGAVAPCLYSGGRLSGTNQCWSVVICVNTSANCGVCVQENKKVSTILTAVKSSFTVVQV